MLLFASDKHLESGGREGGVEGGPVQPTDHTEEEEGGVDVEVCGVCVVVVVGGGLCGLWVVVLSKYLLLQRVW